MGELFVNEKEYWMMQLSQTATALGLFALACASPQSVPAPVDLSSASDTPKALDNPTVVVVAQKSHTNHETAEALRVSLTESLLGLQVDVKNAQAVHDLQDVVSQVGEVAGHVEDEAAQIALALGVDVYLTYSATVTAEPGGRVRVLVRAYETATGEALGEATGSSNKYMKYHPRYLRDAIGRASSRFLESMLIEYKKQISKGLGYYLVFRGQFDDSAKAEVDRMIQTLGKAKRTLATDGTVHYSVRIPGSSDDVMLDLKAELGGIGCRTKIQRGRMVLIRCE